MLQCDTSPTKCSCPRREACIHSHYSGRTSPFARTDVFDIFFLKQQCRGHHRDTLRAETLAQICPAKFQSDLRGLKRQVSLRGREHCDVSVFQTKHIWFPLKMSFIFSFAERRDCETNTRRGRLPCPGFRALKHFYHLHWSLHDLLSA